MIPATHAHAQTSDELARLIRDNRYVVEGSHDALSGPGLDFLIREGRASDFFLLGESHLVREIPLLTERLTRELRPAGYELFAIETGPLTTEWMVERLEAGGVPAFKEVVATMPFTLPFYEQREEAELLASALDDGYRVVGLDQEFVGSGRYWLARLAELAPSEAARRMVAEWQEVEGRAIRYFMRTQKSDSALYQLRTAEEFAALGEAFEGSDEGRRIVDAMATSAHIYQLWRTANYENNRERVAYMKRNLVEELERWEDEARTGAPAMGDTPPRVFMKFGSYHMGRGLSPANQYDLGNLAQELAVVRGGRSLHVQAVAVGRRGEDGSFDRWLEPDSEWGPILEQMTEGPWTVFDLRPLRAWFHSPRNRRANPELAEMVFHYDVVVLAPEFTGSTPMGEMPGSP